VRAPCPRGSHVAGEAARGEAAGWRVAEVGVVGVEAVVEVDVDPSAAAPRLGVPQRDVRRVR
jgi:hypothetical protein